MEFPRKLAVLAPVCVAAVVPAQDDVVADWRVPEPVAASRGDGPFTVVPIVGELQVHLPRPVADWELAELPDGEYVILAGGIRDDLSILRFHAQSGIVERFDTVGGRRLPSAFRDGQGSWPLIGGPRLWMFAWEQDGRVQFRAMAPRRPLASRSDLPLRTHGFEARLDPTTWQVHVTFPGANQALQFTHPDAPRLETSGSVDGRLTFDQGPRELALRNAGHGELSASVVVEGQGFRIVEPVPDAEGRVVLRLPPGGAERLLIVAEEAGACANLRIESVVARCAAVIALEAVPAQAEAVSDRPAVPPPAVAGSGSRPRAAPRAATAHSPALREPAAAIGGEVPTEPGLAEPQPPPVLVPASFQVALAWHDHGLELGCASAPFAVENLRTGRRVRSQPDFDAATQRAVVAARAFDEVRIEAVGTARIERVPPDLRLCGDHVLARVLPGAEAILAAVVPEPSVPGRIRRVEGRWRALGDEAGTVRIPRWWFGPEALDLVLLTRDPAGVLERTSPLRLPAIDAGARTHKAN